MPASPSPAPASAHSANAHAACHRPQRARQAGGSSLSAPVRAPPRNALRWAANALRKVWLASAHAPTAHAADEARSWGPGPSARTAASTAATTLPHVAAWEGNTHESFTVDEGCGKVELTRFDPLKCFHAGFSHSFAWHMHGIGTWRWHDMCLGIGTWHVLGISMYMPHASHALGRSITCDSMHQLKPRVSLGVGEWRHGSARLAAGRGATLASGGEGGGQAGRPAGWGRVRGVREMSACHERASHMFACWHPSTRPARE